jgi:hypothetical protein
MYAAFSVILKILVDKDTHIVHAYFHYHVILLLDLATSTRECSTVNKLKFNMHKYNSLLHTIS